MTHVMAVKRRDEIKYRCPFSGLPGGTILLLALALGDWTEGEAVLVWQQLVRIGVHAERSSYLNASSTALATLRVQSGVE